MTKQKIIKKVERWQYAHSVVHDILCYFPNEWFKAYDYRWLDFRYNLCDMVGKKQSKWLRKAIKAGYKGKQDE